MAKLHRKIQRQREDFAHKEARKLVDQAAPNDTSQICSQCGAIVEKSLGVRVHKCPNCGLRIDRDLNASLNLLKKVGWGTAEFTPAEIGAHFGFRR